jgi:hypothetical protein
MESEKKEGDFLNLVLSMLTNSSKSLLAKAQQQHFKRQWRIHEIEGHGIILP